MLLADFKLVIFNIISRCYVKSKRRQAARQADLCQTASLGSAQMSVNRTCHSFAAAASPFSLNQPRGKLKKKLMIKKLLLHSGTQPLIRLPWQYGHLVITAVSFRSSKTAIHSLIYHIYKKKTLVNWRSPINTASSHILKSQTEEFFIISPSGAPNENIVQNHLNVALLNVF